MKKYPFTVTKNGLLRPFEKTGAMIKVSDSSKLRECRVYDVYNVPVLFFKVSHDLCAFSVLT